MLVSPPPQSKFLATRLHRNVSVRPHQLIYCVCTFDALLRNNLYRFFIRFTSSCNSFTLIASTV